MADTPLSPERLAEIAARATAENLTPGPWRLDREQCDCSDGYCRHGEYVTGVITPTVTVGAAERIARTGEEPRDYDFHRSDVGDFTEADWELMAHAREDVPALLAAFHRQAGRVAELEETLERRRARLVALQNDSLAIRGTLAPCGRPRRVPMELGESLVPAVEWLLNRLTELEQPPRHVWKVWDDKDRGATWAFYATEEDAKTGTITCWEEFGERCPDYSWRDRGDHSLELLAGDEPTGVRLCRHDVHGEGGAR